VQAGKGHIVVPEMTAKANAEEKVIPIPPGFREQRASGRTHASAMPTRFESELFDRVISAAAPDYTGTHCFVSFAGRIDADRLVRAVRLTLDAEPILACRWVEHWFRPSWHRRDDLDRAESCEFRESSNCPADVEDFVKLRPDLPLRVLLLRGDTDLLCVKLDHRAGDGGATKDYVYLLADVYNRLSDDPDYAPAPNVDGRRGVQQLRDRFSLRERLRVSRQSLSVLRKLVPTIGTWKFPRSQNAVLEFVHLRLDPVRVRGIFEYALRQRTTMSQVLVAALYLTICHARPQSSDRPLPITVAVDLRRHLASKHASGLCNLNGVVVIFIDSQSGESLDGVVKQVRDQMQAQRGEYFGLPLSSLAVEGLPIVGPMVGLILYWCIKRVARGALYRNPRILEREVTGRVIFTDLGELEPDRLSFGGTGISAAFMSGGAKARRMARVASLGMVGMAASQFDGSLTLSLGYGPRAFVAELSEELMRVLPA
jgi:NRPS condensation-like uncharacterized protein